MIKNGFFLHQQQLWPGCCHSSLPEVAPALSGLQAPAWAVAWCSFQELRSENEKDRMCNRNQVLIYCMAIFWMCRHCDRSKHLYTIGSYTSLPGPKKKIPQSPTRISYMRYHPGGENIQWIVDLPCQCGNAIVGSDIWRRSVLITETKDHVWLQKFSELEFKGNPKPFSSSPPFRLASLFTAIWKEGRKNLRFLPTPLNVHPFPFSSWQIYELSQRSCSPNSAQR